MNLREQEDQRVVEALSAVEIEVSSIYDLVNAKYSYESAIPVLLELLPTLKDPLLKEGVVRALAVKEARDTAVAPLVREFKKIDPEDKEQQMLKWAIANTLSVVARDSAFNEISSLLFDKKNGRSREMLAVALGNMKKSPDAIDVLVDMLNDNIVAGHAAIALGKLKAKRAIPALEALLDHPKDWVRKEADRAIRKASRQEDETGDRPRFSE